jgi:hypothetical protein
LFSCSFCMFFILFRSSFSTVKCLAFNSVIWKSEESALLLKLNQKHLLYVHVMDDQNLTRHNPDSEIKEMQ